MSRRVACVALLAALLALFGLADARYDGAATTTAATLPTEEPDGLLVRVDPPDGDETRAGQAVAASAGLEFVRSLGDGLVLMQAKDDPQRASSAADALRAAMQRAGTAFPDDGAGASASVASTSLPPPSSLVSQAVASAVASARVRRVEPNLIMRVQAAASECSSTSCSGLWGMTAIRAPQAWALVAGAQAPASYTVRGSVIDTGVQYDHVELDTQMDRSLGATCVGGRCATGADGSDDSGHGTHVSGTIAGKWGGSSGGIVGVLGNADLAMCKMFRASGNGDLADAILCIKHLASKNAAVVINNSWGGTGRSQELFEAIRDYVCKPGGLFLAAAGNGDASGNGQLMSANGGFFPARYSVEAGAECVLPVAATDRYGDLADFSNYGTDVPLAAPGVGIKSSVWSATSKTKTVSWDGTSMATPHVTGVALLLKNSFPSLTGMQIKEILIRTATGRVSGIAGGVLNAEAAYLEAQRVVGTAPPPPAPTLTCVGTKTIELTAAANNCETGVAVRAEDLYTALNVNGEPTTADSVAPVVGTILAAGDTTKFDATLSGAPSCSTTVSVIGCANDQANDMLTCLSPSYTLAAGQCAGIKPPDSDLFTLRGGVPGRGARGSASVALPEGGLLGPGVHTVAVTASAGGAQCSATVTVQPCAPVIARTTTSSRSPLKLPTAPGTCLVATDSADVAAAVVSGATLGRGAIGIRARASTRGAAVASGPLKAGRYSVAVVYPGGIVSPFSAATINIGVADAEAPTVAIKESVARQQGEGEGSPSFICAVAATARATSACVSVGTGATSVVSVADNCGATGLTRKFTCTGAGCPRTLPTARATKLCVPVSANKGRVEAVYTMTVTDKSSRSASVNIPIAGYHASVQRPADATKCYSA